MLQRPPETQGSPRLIHTPSCHAFPPPPRGWEALGVHLQEYLLTLWPSSKKDLGSKGSVPAVELIPAVEENVGEGKGEEKHLEVGSWQLSPQFQGAAPGEETALWKTDRRVCSEGCKGEFLNAKENRGEKKREVDSARNNSQWRKAGSCFPGMGTLEHVLVFWHPAFHPWAPHCPGECGHGMAWPATVPHILSVFGATSQHLPVPFMTWNQH